MHGAGRSSSRSRRTLSGEVTRRMLVPVARHHGEAARPLTVRDARLLRQRGDLGTAWVAPGARRHLTAMSLAGGSFGLRLGPPLHETGCPGVERLEGRGEVLLCLFTFGVQARSFEDPPVAQQRHDHIVVVDA